MKRQARIFCRCAICVDKANVIIPCGNGGMCFRFGLILARKVGEKICPICRAKIGEVLKIDGRASESTADGKLILVAKEGMRVHARPSNSNNNGHDDARLINNETNDSATSADNNNVSIDEGPHNNRTVEVSNDTENNIFPAGGNGNPAANNDDDVGSVGSNTSTTEAGTGSEIPGHDGNEGNINVLADNSVMLSTLTMGLVTTLATMRATTWCNVE